MNWKAWLITAVVIAAAIIAYMLYPTGSSADGACTASGGTVTTQMCCGSASNFPNTCLIGACGCSPSNSHEVKVCDCEQGKCWNGKECV